jgi:hypothetical protein
LIIAELFILQPNEEQTLFFLMSEIKLQGNHAGAR